MTSSECTSEVNSQDETIELKSLEPLLQQSLKNNELQVVHSSITKLLPPGENYASLMLKIDTKIRKNKSAREEMLHLVAKTPTCSTEKCVSDWPLLFKKELFMYVELGPLYRQLEREARTEESELINIWPKYVGHRNSLNDESKIDQDSLMLMENVKSKGFYMLDRRVGLDIHHARKALIGLARYHALGIVMQKKRPAFFEMAVVQARVLGLNFAQLDDGYDKLITTFLETPSLHKYLSVIESSFEQMKDGKTFKAEPTEPWATITHGDFWTNNILFHKDNEGNVDDVKFVDFQTYLYNSPLKDVPYFLCTSLDKDTQTDYLDELIVLYYNTFIRTLKRMSCDISLFTKDSFTSELKKQAINEFPLSALATKFFQIEFGENSENNAEFDYIFNAEVSHGYIEKLKWIIEIYEKLGWF